MRKSILVVHLHGIGDWMMFTPSIRLLNDNNYQIDVITGLNSTTDFISSAYNFNVIFHSNVRSFLGSFLIFFYLFFSQKKKYHRIYVTAGMSWLKLFFLQFAFLFHRNVFSVSNKKSFIYFINILPYFPNQHKAFNNHFMVSSSLNFHAYVRDLSYYLPNSNFFAISGDRSSILIHPGNDSKNKYRRLPLSTYVRVISTLISICPESVVKIILGPDEVDLKEEFLSLLPLKYFDTGNVLFVVAPTFIDLFGLFSSSRILLVNDSGLAHIAAAFPIKVLNLFGPADPADTSPLSLNQEILLPDIVLGCMPCVKINGRNGCSEQYCMRAFCADELVSLLTLA